MFMKPLTKNKVSNFSNISGNLQIEYGLRSNMNQKKGNCHKVQSLNCNIARDDDDEE